MERSLYSIKAMLLIHTKHQLPGEPDQTQFPTTRYRI